MRGILPIMGATVVATGLALADDSVLEDFRVDAFYKLDSIETVIENQTSAAALVTSNANLLQGYNLSKENYEKLTKDSRQLESSGRDTQIEIKKLRVKMLRDYRNCLIGYYEDGMNESYIGTVFSESHKAIEDLNKWTQDLKERVENAEKFIENLVGDFQQYQSAVIQQRNAAINAIATISHVENHISKAEVFTNSYLANLNAIREHADLTKIKFYNAENEGQLDPVIRDLDQNDNYAESVSNYLKKMRSNLTELKNAFQKDLVLRENQTVDDLFAAKVKMNAELETVEVEQEELEKIYGAMNAREKAANFIILNLKQFE